MPQGRVPDRRKSVVRSLLRVLQRRSKIFHSVLHTKGRRPCQKARKPHLTRCCSIYYICIYQILSLLLRHKKGLQHGIEKGHRGGPGKTHPKTQAAPSGNGGQPHTMAFQHYRSHAETDLLGIMIIQPGHQVVLCAGNRKDAGHPGRKKNAKPVPFIYVIIN